jgi:hypothetical protein
VVGADGEAAVEVGDGDRDAVDRDDALDVEAVALDRGDDGDDVVARDGLLWSQDVEQVGHEERAGAREVGDEELGDVRGRADIVEQL